MAAYFVINDTTIFLPADYHRRAIWRARATHFWSPIKSLKKRNVQISLLLIWYVFASLLSWVVNAFSSEKRCPSSMAFLYQADWHINLPRFQGARPDHVQVKSSSCSSPYGVVLRPRELVDLITCKSKVQVVLRPRELVDLNPWQWPMTWPSLIGKRIRVGRYSNKWRPVNSCTYFEGNWLELVRLKHIYDLFQSSSSLLGSGSLFN